MINMKMTRESVNNGRQLKFAREYRGYTQVSLCEQIKGLKQSNLSKYERGFQGMLKQDKIIEIMKFLDFPIKFLDVSIPKLYTSWDL